MSCEISNPCLVFITGASGGGKTTILKLIEKELDPNLVSVHYFDDIGVPSFDEMLAIMVLQRNGKKPRRINGLINLPKLMIKSMFF